MEIKKRKSKISYTIMIVSDSAKKHMKRFHVKTGAVGFVSVMVFLLIVVNVCYVVYSSITLSDSVERVKGQQQQITVLEEKNKQLTVENDGLSSKVSILSETVNQKVVEEQVQAAETEELHLPKGFPFSGSAQVKTADTEQAADDENADRPITPSEPVNGGVIFTGSEGIHAITSGAGTVLKVDADINYGNVICIDHGNGYISEYRNHGKPMVKLGETVSRGTILYIVGEDNKDMEYSIQKDGTYINPMDMIEING